MAHTYSPSLLRLSRYLLIVWLIIPLNILNMPLLRSEDTHLTEMNQDNPKAPSHPAEDFPDFGPYDEPLQGPRQEMPSMESLLMKTFLMLIFIIGALISALWLLKRLQSHGTTRTQGSQNHIEIIEKKYLSSKCSLWYATINGIPYAIIEGQHGVALSQITHNQREEKALDRQEDIHRTSFHG